MSNVTQLIFAKGVYAAVSKLGIERYTSKEARVKYLFNQVMSKYGYQESRINELYEECKLG